MAEDIRVVVIKLADRLHNMRTLDALPPDQAAAHRPRDDGDLRAAGPPPRPRPDRPRAGGPHVPLPGAGDATTTSPACLTASRESRERYVAQVEKLLRYELQRQGVQAELSGRAKHIFSIHQKMQKYAEMGEVVQRHLRPHRHPRPGQHASPTATTPSASCTASGGRCPACSTTTSPTRARTSTSRCTRRSWAPARGRWRCRSAPTRCTAPPSTASPRTGATRKAAATTAHFEERITWLRQLLDWQRETAEAEEFVEFVKTDLFRDQVFVFSPKGEIKDLPAGSTPIDFAFRIHTDIGFHCVGARVNGRLVPLTYKLQNGDVVEIITSRTSRGPSRDWLNPNLGYVKTGNARSKIRQWFKRQERDENILRGREMVERELKRLGVSVDRDLLPRAAEVVPARQRRRPLRLRRLRRHQPQPDRRPHRPPPQQGRARRRDRRPSSRPGRRRYGTDDPVLGTGDVLTQIARCCNPVPGDPIIGYVTRARGVTIHRQRLPQRRQQHRSPSASSTSTGAARPALPGAHHASTPGTASASCATSARSRPTRRST